MNNRKLRCCLEKERNEFSSCNDRLDCAKGRAKHLVRVHN